MRWVGCDKETTVQLQCWVDYAKLGDVLRNGIVEALLPWAGVELFSGALFTWALPVAHRGSPWLTVAAGAMQSGQRLGACGFL